MNIAIDIDDTLTDSFDYFQPFVAEYFGISLEELKEKNISYGNLPQELKKDELGFCKTYYDRTAENTPFKPDASEAIKELKARGHRIVIITGRTTDFYTDPYKTTEKELENGKIVYDKLICTLDKQSACKEEKTDVLIDDMPSNCKAATQCGISALLFESKANKEIETDLTRVRSWSEVLKIIK